MKTLDARLSDCQVMKRITNERLDSLRAHEESLTIKQKSRMQEKDRVGGQAKKIRFGFLGPKKKIMQSKSSDLEHELRTIGAQISAVSAERKILEDKLSAYTNI